MNLILKDCLVAFIFIISISLSNFLFGTANPPLIRVSPQESQYHAPALFWKFIDWGNHLAVADLLWIKTLIDADLEVYQKADLGSWMYIRFNTISDLDPNFRENYFYGGQYLMIVKDDINGAHELFKKGLQLYPNDYDLNYQMGFLHAFELHDTKAAYKYFDRIKTHPSRPEFFDTFFTKLASHVLGPSDAYHFALKQYEQYTDDNNPIKQRLKIYLYSLKADLDLDCLNSKRENCAKSDFYGRNYVKNSKGWTTATPYKKLKLNIKN